MRLTDYKYEPSSLCCGFQRATFTLSLFVEFVYFGPAFAHHRFPASCLNWVDSLTWTRGRGCHWVTPRFQAAVSNSINLRWIVGFSWLSPIGYFTPEILNRIHILRIGRQGNSASWCCSSWHFHLTTNLARWHSSLSSFKKNRCWNKAMLIVPRISAVGLYRCICSHWHLFHRQCPTSLWAIIYAAPDCDFQKMLHCQIHHSFQAYRLGFF